MEHKHNYYYFEIISILTVKIIYLFCLQNFFKIFYFLEDNNSIFKYIF